MTRTIGLREFDGELGRDALLLELCLEGAAALIFCLVWWKDAEGPPSLELPEVGEDELSNGAFWVGLFLACDAICCLSCSLC